MIEAALRSCLLTDAEISDQRRLEADPDHQNPPRAASNGVGVDTYA